MDEKPPIEMMDSSIRRGVCLREFSQIVGVIVLSHFLLTLFHFLLPHTIFSIGHMQFILYLAVLSPAIVVVLRYRPLEGIRAGLPFYQKLPLTILGVGAALFAGMLGLTAWINQSTVGDALWILEVSRSILANGVMLLLTFASAGSLGLTTGFVMDMNRLG